MLDKVFQKCYYSVTKMKQKGGEMMNIKKLRAKMVEAGYNQCSLALATGIKENTLCSRFTEKTEFNIGEVKLICDTIGITDGEEIKSIFFN